MIEQYRFVERLTDPSQTPRREELSRFAREFGWHPSDHLYSQVDGQRTIPHLVVEHGLDTTAVISFLPRGCSLPSLETRTINRLLSVSYNNLIDWHIFIESDWVSSILNSYSPFRISSRQEIASSNFDVLSSENFAKLTDQNLHPNLRALDTALIDTISYWRRFLYQGLAGSLSTTALSDLINAIIFLRAYEDTGASEMWQSSDFKSCGRLDTTLLSRVESSGQLGSSILKILHSIPNNSDSKFAFLENESELSTFDSLDQGVAVDLLSDFYKNKFAPYSYDFSLISKHALSRITEKYVSGLRFEEREQLSFTSIPDLPEEENLRAFGAYYTPQYIAGFFGRYLMKVLPSRGIKASILDPACGSGIFLRTFIEQCIESDGGEQGKKIISIEEVLPSVAGYDIDNNATNAARLSLSLLHLSKTGRMPETLNLNTADLLTVAASDDFSASMYDVVIANPPFIAWDALDVQTRTKLSTYLGHLSKGKVDINLAFLKFGVDSLMPGGYGLFVLPHTFYIKESAAQLRLYLSQHVSIKCLVDLTSLPVFGNTGTYITLLIFQKNIASTPSVTQQPVTVVRCQESPERALQAVLDERYGDEREYSVFTVEQSAFSGRRWFIVPHRTTLLIEKLERHTSLSNLIQVRQGLITGADQIFLRPSSQIPDGEQDLYVPFLPDRDITAYKLTGKIADWVIYPYQGDRALSEDELSRNYPQSWNYLERNREKLDARTSKTSRKWWQLHSPAKGYLLQKKLVTPHLVMSPKFAFDNEGKFAVSRSPFLVQHDNSNYGDELFYYLLGILNTDICYWYAAINSHKYGRGYALLEVMTLKQIPVPDPASSDPILVKKLIDYVRERISCPITKQRDIEVMIEKVARKLFLLTDSDLKTMELL